MRDMRLEVRIPSEDKERLVRAAAADGLTMSQFVRTAVAARADAVLAELHEITLLDAETYERVFELLARPADLSPELRAAAAPVTPCPRMRRPASAQCPAGSSNLRHSFLSQDEELNQCFARATGWTPLIATCGAAAAMRKSTGSTR